MELPSQIQDYYSSSQEILFSAEDGSEDCPPKLPPISGVLAAPEADHPIIRPVAHRPESQQPTAIQPPLSTWSSPSTGYGSGSGSCCSDVRSLSFLEDHEHPVSSGDESLQCESPRLNRRNCTKVTKRLWSSPTSIGQPVASGRDSNDVETILKDKLAEISLLRRTLEENEQVIVKVYAEKEQIWRSEIDKIKNHYEQKMEELRQETAKQILKYSELKPNVKCINCHHESALSTNEIRMSNDRDMTNRRQSLVLPTSKSSEKNYYLTESLEYGSSVTQTCLISSSVCNINGFKVKNNWNSNNKKICEEEQLRLEVEALRLELIETKKELKQERELLKEDRKRWKEERERVSSYQEQLHENYIQSWKRGRILETQLQATKAQLDKFLRESQC